ncbi:deaminase [Pseudodesulfovibrio sp. JC047]|uniref:RidA family protein n=1 Tax=Pseudodesulfovibrio sp. JC047 TaxID=2683199 RepID=UPI0013D86BAE|nr:Rid family detoxifying hydrolase [Pseudodesulfovibrio sp. JC047]NDV19486.1 deaminase [Pseudodesulfovibrio sp. JC047]
MEYLNDKNAPEPLGPYSDSIRSGNMLYLSGQAPFGQSGELVGSTIGEQTTQAMDNMASLLESVGLGMKNVVKVTVYLANWDDFPSYNEVYKSFMGDHKPARATVEVSRLAGGALIEMESIAEFS